MYPCQIALLLKKGETRKESGDHTVINKLYIDYIYTNLT